MSWWDIIKVDDDESLKHASYFYLFAMKDKLQPLQAELNTKEERDYFEEMVGKPSRDDGISHYLVISPIEEETMEGMRGRGALSTKQKLDLVRQSPDKYCLVETVGDRGYYFGPNTTLRHILGSELIFNRARVALENAKQQIIENKRD